MARNGQYPREWYEWMYLQPAHQVTRLAHDQVPGDMEDELRERGIVFKWPMSGGRLQVTFAGLLCADQVMRDRHLNAKPEILSDDQRNARNVGKVAESREQREQRKQKERVDREAWLAERRREREAKYGRPPEKVRQEQNAKRRAERSALIAERKELKKAFMDTRPLLTTDCEACGSEIEYKILRIFDVNKRYECLICGQKVKPLKRRLGGGRLPVIMIPGSGFCAVVCRDCVNYCSSCWTKPTYKHIMKVYGVDLRD